MSVGRRRAGGMTSPIVRVRPSLSARALALGRKSSSSMTSWIRRRVAYDTVRLPLSAYDTVLRDTPARRATSPMFIHAPVRTDSRKLRGRSKRSQRG
jgi:hypothetical protein